MKLEQGDVFEAQNARWIREHLPSYEGIWAAFIGHNGFGGALPMRCLSPKQAFNRERFCQAHYSFAVDAYQLDKLVSSPPSFTSEVMGLTEFLDYQLQLILAVALVGRIRDMFKSIDNALRMGGDLFKEMQDYYDQRSNILHGPRLPVTLCDGRIKIPQIAGQYPVAGEWERKSVWSNVDPKSFASLQAFGRGLRDDVFESIQEHHPKVFPAAVVFFDGLRVSDNAPAPTLPVHTLSGLAVDPDISADMIPLSGVPSILGSSSRNLDRT